MKTVPFTVFMVLGLVAFTAFRVDPALRAVTAYGNELRDISGQFSAMRAEMIRERLLRLQERSDDLTRQIEVNAAKRLELDGLPDQLRRIHQSIRETEASLAQIMRKHPELDDQSP